ncbi:replication factor A1 [Angomonas deanei]|uniref:Replication protein A OB domain/Replication factor-A C terminal domain containing protein, putative n=1 Tax=Angomonas deanei TaxID=59799 RepID=A0A7G2CIF6_9TRYP|nr:replication factor A1 [Angomonas deanei]CAD2218837.1 Replication protein A OB domain/Replication factor-A C terminal domain containing protein, putative [Angomonas deanei]|eukprot:EPY38614.1 replication factor A1 [Angomonas deanei]
MNLPLSGEPCSMTPWTPFEPLLVEGQVYYFSGGQVKNANRKFNNVNNDYELTFDKGSEIMLARGDAAAAALPVQRFNFVPIEVLRQREAGSLVDVLGVIVSVDEVSAITQKATGKELIKRNVKIADATAAVDLTVWNDEAKAWTLPAGTVLALSSVKTGSYEGVTLSTTFQTKMEVNPPSIANDVRKLSDWYVATGGQVQSLSGQGRGSGAMVSENYQGRRYIDELATDGLGRGMKPDFVDIRCVPIYIKQESLWYEACPNCNKKVTAEGAQGDRHRCEKCDTHVVPVPRYMISIQVTDHVSQVWMTLFNEAGVEFFGMTAEELKTRTEQDSSFLTMLTRSRMNRPVLIRVRVKEEQTMNSEGGDRLRLTALKIKEFMPLATANEETRVQLAQNLKAECEDMIKCIQAYA